MKPVAARSIVKVGHVRMFVDCPPDAVSDKFRHHAKTDAPRFAFNFASDMACSETEPPGNTESFGLVRTVGGRDRTSTSNHAADCFKAPASAARGRLRRIQSECTTPSA
jgi:hypothetical protein